MKNKNSLSIVIVLVSFCFALAPATLAVDPPPDGGYPGLNTAEGEDALFSDSSGYQNTAIGWQAMYGTTTGTYNTAIGAAALQSNSTGNGNTVIGNVALQFGSGSYNTATGNAVLRYNTGSYNTASGNNALNTNTSGSHNTATGNQALTFNDTGSDNTAIGNTALAHNISGAENTAIGSAALFRNKHGGRNVALGFSAGSNTTGNHNIDIGNEGVLAESNTIRIGKDGTQKNAYVAGINGVTIPSGVNVVIDMSGHLGTVTSSARYKKNIQPMKDASDKVLALRPVTFEYKDELDPQGIPQFGLVAEDVAKVDPDLVIRDEKGKPYTVRYDAVNSMLLNEFLKEHKKVEEQASKIERLEDQVQQMAARLETEGF